MKIRAAVSRTALALAAGMALTIGIAGSAMASPAVPTDVAFGPGWHHTTDAVVKTADALTVHAPSPTKDASQQLTASRDGSVGVQVAWYFDTCEPRNYRLDRLLPWLADWIYVHHHDDPGIRYYRVVDTNGDIVGNGWASCAP